MIEAIVAVVALALGFGAARFLGNKENNKLELEAQERAKKIESDAKEKAQLIVREAESKQEGIKKEKILEAKEKFMKMKADFESETSQRKEELIKAEQSLKDKQSDLKGLVEKLDRREAEIESLQENLTAQLEIVKKRKEEAEKLKLESASKLEKVASLSAEEATQQLMEIMKNEALSRSSTVIKNIEDEARQTATRQAKKIVIDTIQRTATEHAIENCVSVFNIESDDIKGKIIGREGRNIRAIEAATGVEIIVDDTPEAIVISGHDPVRREVARLSLHRLVQDGRIHPARIEEIVNKTFKDIEEEIVEIGERTCIDMNINGLHPQLIRMVGRMRFRSSYGQNLLQHSREVSNMCAIMAAEMGLNVKQAKRAGLLHDIGKVAENQELPHALAGMELAKKYNEHPDICNAIGAHHDEIEMTCMIAPVVQACDAISGARPGARREVMESYIKRLKELEETALSFEGVSKCYAIQAGRELRVMVDAENVSDEKAGTLSFEISQKIENEMQYPGQIKVTVIREMRAINYAK